MACETLTWRQGWLKERQALTTCMRVQIALEGQDMPRRYLGHHELESGMLIMMWTCEARS